MAWFSADRPFLPMPGLANGHLMTIGATFWHRSFADVLQSQSRQLLRVCEDSQVLVESNAASAAGGSDSEPGARAGVLLVHGLEGSSRSHYLLGLARKLSSVGLHSFRMNMRNCGDTMHLTPTLYNAGLSADVISVGAQLVEAYGLQRLYLVGFSLGGNVVLKAASELASTDASWLGGVCAVSPSIDLLTCVSAIEQGFNRVYEKNFLIGLKAKIKAKERLFPGRFDVSRLAGVKTVRQFDDTFTAPDGGWSCAEEYYENASSLPLIEKIEVPALIIAAKDDPIVPFGAFLSESMNSPNVSLLSPDHGGHAGFVAADPMSCVPDGDFTFRDRFWAENQIARFCILSEERLSSEPS